MKFSVLQVHILEFMEINMERSWKSFYVKEIAGNIIADHFEYNNKVTDDSGPNDTAFPQSYQHPPKGW